MSDEQQPREPILKPKDDAKFKAGRRKEPVNPEDHEPVLLDEGFYHKKVKPPYSLFILVFFGVLLACWKMWMHGGLEGVEKQHQQMQIKAQEITAELQRN